MLRILAEENDDRDPEMHSDDDGSLPPVPFYSLSFSDHEADSRTSVEKSEASSTSATNTNPKKREAPLLPYSFEPSDTDDASSESDAGLTQKNYVKS